VCARDHMQDQLNIFLPSAIGFLHLGSHVDSGPFCHCFGPSALVSNFLHTPPAVWEIIFSMIPAFEKRTLTIESRGESEIFAVAFYLINQFINQFPALLMPNC
jgi:hypothetical protein